MNHSDMMQMFQQMMNTFQQALQDQNETLTKAIKNQTEVMNGVVAQQNNINNMVTSITSRIERLENTQQMPEHPNQNTNPNTYQETDNDDEELQMPENNNEELQMPEQRDGFSMWAEMKYSEQFPQEYQILTQNVDFDPRYFTVSTEMIPLYAKGMSKKRFASAHGMFNETIWSEIPRGSKESARQQTDRMLAINDPNYRPRRLDLQGARGKMKVINSGQATQVTGDLEVVTANKKRAATALRRIGVANVPFNQKGRFLPTSLTQPEIVRLYNGALENIGEISERAYFNGLITRTRYEVLDTVLENITPEMFSTLLRKALIQKLNTDLVNEGLPPYYNVFVYYTEFNNYIEGSTVRRRVYNAIAGDDITQLMVDFSIDTTIMEMYGSDINDERPKREAPPPVISHFELDPSRFEIEKIDVTRAGAGKGCNTNHNYKKKVYDWGRVRDYNSKNSGCFVKILAEVLKVMGVKGPNEKPWRYDGLWRHLDTTLKTKTFGTPVTPEWGDQAAQLFGLCLIVINNFSEITYDSSIQPDSKILCKPSNTLRVLLENEHYYHVVHWAPRISPDGEKHKYGKAPKLKPLREYINVCYDLETVNTVTPGAEVHVIPYANAWVIADKDVNVSITDDPNPFEVLDNMIHNIMQDFNQRDLPISEEVDSTGKKGKANTHVFYRMIAYNGSKFDHALLFLYLTSNNWDIIQPPSATGKIRSMRVFLGSRLIADDITNKQYAKAFLEIWDPCLFTSAPLRNVAVSFGLELSKGDLNHEEVQTAYAEGRLGEWLAQNKQKLVDYNSMDVKVLRELVKRLVDAMGPEIFNYSTISGMCYNKWLNLQYDNKTVMKNVVIPVEDFNIDALIRSAIIGGRVEGQPGDHIFHQGAKMLDVVSLYPFVMKTNSFPIGKEKIITNLEEAKIYFQNNTEFIGLYSIEYDQSKMKTPHPVLPVRINSNKKGTTLDWTWEGVRKAGPQHAILPDITIYDLLDSKADVHWSDNISDGNNTIYAIVWERSPDGAVFREYVNTYGNIKQEEDRKKSLNLPYNPTLREMSKLMLNSLGGKMSQRNFRNQSKFWTKEKDLRTFIEENHNAKPTPYIVSKNAVFTVTPLSDEQSYKNPHPSQIGVFIYAYARHYMWTLFFSKMKVWYSDTDSALISSSDFQKIDPNLIVTENKKHFGMLELEKQPSRAIIIAPKTYLLLKSVGLTQKTSEPKMSWTVEKFGLKGVRKTDLWECDGNLIPINENILRFFLHLLNNKEVTVHTWTFRNAIREGRLEHANLIKVIKNTTNQDDTDTNPINLDDASFSVL